MRKLIILFLLFISGNVFASKEKLDNVFEQNNWQIISSSPTNCSGQILANDKITALKFRIFKVKVKLKGEKKDYVGLDFRIETNKPYSSFSLVADNDEVPLYVSVKKEGQLNASLMPSFTIKTLEFFQKPAKNIFIKLDGVSKSKKTNLNLSNVSAAMKFLKEKCPKPSPVQLFLGILPST